MSGKSLNTLGYVLMGLGIVAVIIGLFDGLGWFTWVAVVLWLVAAAVFITFAVRTWKARRSSSAS